MASVTKVVGAVAEENFLSTDVAGANLSNMTVDDANYASWTVNNTLNTPWLRCTMSGNEFEIPAGARIDGVVVEVDVDTADGSGLPFLLQNVQLVVDGAITGLDLWNRTEGAGPAGVTTLDYGSSTDNWGVPLNTDAVNTATFGFAIRFARVAATARTLRCYVAKVTVHYTESAGHIPNELSDIGVCLTTVQMASNTTTQRFAFPGMGTIKAAMLFAINCTDSDLTLGSDSLRSSANLWLHTAATDGTLMRQHQSRVATGAYTVNRSNFTDRLFETTVSKQIDISAFGAGYVEVSHVSADASTGIALMCVAFGGSDCSAVVGSQNGLDGSTSATSVISCGFEPDLVILLSGLKIYTSGHDVYGGSGIGLVHNGDTVAQVNALAEWRFKESTAGGDLTDNANSYRVGNDRAHTNINWGDVGGDGEEYSWSLGSFGADGFTITSDGDDGTSEDGSAYLALKFSAGSKVAVGTIASPTSSGSQSPTLSTAPSFVPRFMFVAQTLGTALNTRTNDSGNADLIAFWAARHNIIASVGATVQNGQATSNALGYIDRARQLALFGDQTTALAAGLPTFASGGFSATYATVDASARYGVFLAFAGPAPSITSVSPSSVANGSSGTLTFVTTGVVDGATVSVDAGLTLGSLTVNSSTESVCSYTATAVGTSTITITNPDGQSDTITFAVTALSSAPGAIRPIGTFARRRR